MLIWRQAPCLPAVWLNQRAVPLYVVVGIARWEALAGEGTGETGKMEYALDFDDDARSSERLTSCLSLTGVLCRSGKNRVSPL